MPSKRRPGKSGEEIMWKADELGELKERISQMSDDELLQIVEVESDDYREEAVGFAKAELEKRNIPYDLTKPAEPTAAEDSVSVAYTKGDWPCEVCGGAMRSGSLFADKELTILFR